ncbi:MAG: response regulator [Pseudomonadota bacterium]
MAGRIGRLMVVDDNAIDQRLYRRIVERSGRVDDMISCLSGQEALDHLNEEGSGPVDVILLDINMPRMNGFEFLEVATERLGPDFASMVIIMLTTSLDPGDVVRAQRFGAVRDLFHKPLTSTHIDQIAGFIGAEAGPAAPHRAP